MQAFFIKGHIKDEELKKRRKKRKMKTKTEVKMRGMESSMYRNISTKAVYLVKKID